MKNLNGYREIHFGPIKLEEAVRRLLDHKDVGQKVFCNFNGHILCSDTVTMDSAYLEITGMKKDEFDRKKQEMWEKHRREEEKYQKQIPNLTKKWIEEGHKVLDKQYWSKWEQCVPIRLNDLYKGKELGDCLEIIKVLNNGCSLSAAKEIIEGQNHSGASYALVKAMVREFCKRGEEFVKYVD